MLPEWPRTGGTLNAFTDPRVVYAPHRQTPAALTTTRADDLSDLYALCRGGRLYDVERWIQAGRPVQLTGVTLKGRVTSALEIALETGNQALILLLLANGYDPNAEVYCP